MINNNYLYLYIQEFEGRFSTRKSYGVNKPTEDEVEVAIEIEKSIKSKK